MRRGLPILSAPGRLATGYAVAGRVTDASGGGLAGVTIAVDGVNSAVTDGAGNYSIAQVAAGSHTLQAAKTGLSFSPPKRAVSGPPDASARTSWAPRCPPSPGRSWRSPYSYPAAAWAASGPAGRWTPTSGASAHARHVGRAGSHPVPLERLGLVGQPVSARPCHGPRLRHRAGRRLCRSQQVRHRRCGWLW